MPVGGGVEGKLLRMAEWKKKKDFGSVCVVVDIVMFRVHLIFSCHSQVAREVS
jgi:hypothetical protein